MGRRKFGQSKIGGHVFVLLFGVACVVGAGAAYWSFFVLADIRFRDSVGWERVPCTIVESRVVQFGSDHTHSGRKHSHRADISYTYDFLGKSYTSNRIDFAYGASSSDSMAEAWVTEFPKGSKTFCLVDPKDPNLAVLKRRLADGATQVSALLMIVILLLLGGCAVWQGSRKLRFAYNRWRLIR